MAETNSTILGRFYLSGSNDMQQRLDNPSQAGIAKVANTLFDPMNQDIYNQFMNFMINRVAYSYARVQQFKNPLREFFKQNQTFGSTITEQQLNWIKGHTYDVDAEEQFKTYFPDGLQAFHSINTRRQYPISVNQAQMRQAFVDETGLNQTVAAIMAQPMNADEYDKMDMMLDLFAKADNEYGLYREHLDSSPLTREGGEELLVKLRQYAVDLTIPTSGYACVDLPVFANPDEMVLFIPSDVQASVDVRNLAVVFELEKADIPYRIKKIAKKKWPLKETDRCILTTGDFFQCYNFLYSTTSQWDAQGLKTNYWLNDHDSISFSPFVPCIVFSEDEGTVLPTVTVSPTSLELDAEVSGVKPGGVVQLTTTLNGTITPESEHGTVEMAPDAALFTIAATREGDAGTEQVQLNTKTYVDRLGKLHVQRSGLKAGDTLTVSAVSVYQNPSGTTEPLTAYISLEVLA